MNKSILMSPNVEMLKVDPQKVGRDLTALLFSLPNEREQLEAFRILGENVFGRIQYDRIYHEVVLGMGEMSASVLPEPIKPALPTDD